MKVLFPAKDIPLQSVVTKRSGDKRHVLLNEIKIHGMNMAPIKPPTGSLFLVGLEMSYSFSVVDENTELLWIVSEYEMFNYLQTKLT